MPSKGKINNPTGKGGFSDNPQNRVNGWWNKEGCIPYWQNYFLSLTVEAFNNYFNKHPEHKRIMAAEIAYKSVNEARTSLYYLREVTDRTSGKSTQPIDHTTAGEKITQFKIEVTKPETAEKLEKWLNNEND